MARKETDQQKIVNDIIERRNECRRWQQSDLYPECEEVWRSIKCRTKTIFKRDAAGNATTEEDTTRTNVDMGLGNLVYRKNVARLSARPYSLKVIGGSDPTVGPRLSAKLAHDYDRSHESIQDVRVRMGAEAFGMGVSKLYWDFVEQEKQVRKALMRGGQVIPNTRADVMRSQGAPEDEITQATKSVDEGGLGPDLSNQEVSQYLAKSGDEVRVMQTLTKYEGPIVKNVFIGRLYYRPFVRLLSESDYIGEDYEETDLWLKKMAQVTYTDPETGEKGKKAFNQEALDALKSIEPTTNTNRNGIRDLEDRFRNIDGKRMKDSSELAAAKRIRKRYHIIEEHSKDDSGKLWITWVSEDYKDMPLGKMPYPCDTQGRWLYTEEVPLPDLIDAIGDSTPRLMRFLLAMYNLQTAQNFDYVTQTMRRMVLAKTGMNFGNEIVKFGNFDLYHTDMPEGVKEFVLQTLPPGAFERGAQLLQLLFMFEPSLSGVAAGNDANPLAGKTATTSILAAKAADVLLQFKIDGRNMYLYELGMKKLAMYQQMAESKWAEVDDQGNPKYAWEIGSRFFGPQLTEMLNQDDGKPPEWALSDNSGSTSAVRLDPMEIQEDLEVEPEAGSYLAVDDQLKQDAVQRAAAIAQQAPGVVDPRKLAVLALGTVRDIGNPEDFLLPAPDPTAPIRPDKFTLTANIGIPLDKVEPDVQAELLARVGIQPPPSLADEAQVKTIERASRGGDAAANLLGSAQEAQPQQTQAKPDSESRLRVSMKKKTVKANGGTEEFSVTQ